MQHVRPINLLPPDQRAGLARRRLNDRLLKYAALFFACIGFGLLVLTAYVDTIRQQRDTVASQADKLAANLGTFSELTQEAIAANDRLEAIAALRASRRSWTQVLTDLAASTPADVEIKALSPTLKNTTPIFSLSAEAGSRASMIALKTALEATGSFSLVTFERSNLVDSARPDSRVTFTLTGQIGDQPVAAPSSPATVTP